MSEHKENPLRGKRYVNHIRVSTDIGQERSADAQLLVNNEFAKRAGMKHVKDFVLEGVSGSQTFNRRDIQSLIDEKENNDSFDIVLYRDLSRLTRGGISHGHATKRRLKAAGITVIPIMDNIPEGPMGELYETFLFFQNQEYSRKLSEQITPNIAKSVKEHRRPPSGRPTYGFDRQYYQPDGTPTRIVRCTPTCREIIDPKTLVVTQRIPNSLAFTKLKFECCRLVLGAKDRVEVVRWMFEQYYKHNRGHHQIAGDLNARGVVGPSGGDWNPTTVTNAVFNPAYIGRMIAFRETAGIYHSMSGMDGPPQKSKISQEELEQKNLWSVPAVRQDEKHWHEWFEPEAAKMIIDPVVLALAQIGIQGHLDAWTAPRANKTPTKTRINPLSTYFLRDVLKLTGFPKARITGHSGGQKTPDGYKNLKRYYITRAIQEVNWRRGTPKQLHRMIRADTLEAMVWDAVTAVFADTKFVADSTTTNVAKVKAHRKKESTFDQLDAKERKLTKRLKFISLNIDDENEALFTKESESIQRDLREVRRAKLSTGFNTAPEADPKVVTQKLAEYFKALPQKPGRSAAVNERLRSFANTVVSKLEVNADNLEVAIEIVIPSWAMNKGGSPSFGRNANSVMCENDSTFQGNFVATQVKKACFRGKIPLYRYNPYAKFDLKRLPNRI